ncbi:coenzyme PQQ synthesis protein D (PqqD) [Neobacillus bataviensis]|uniref:Coenzyme PQQ synthesis protein D (PqqD) n=1 Tax=Neobacillus bataviensis TaxID=220685 RepID=A0A561D659_9BACI|nr:MULTISPECIES: lasso peptide biosynthesis PqqD family chaperone [Neobacillus]MCM3724930.1 lasso peptide biosynthesis PqqD family chaperone [Neobacillus cucumis]TWD98925.1 coenzyme PQQ synthesis protein D (PqqD) [Neobacillus bataviensis]
MKMLSTNNFTMETTIVQSPGNIISDMGGETVMMSIDNGKYYNLGSVGGYIWSNIEKPISINQLILTLTREFNVETSKCQKEVMPFIELLLNEKLISIEKA